jgi:hypothetical protein
MSTLLQIGHFLFYIFIFQLEADIMDEQNRHWTPVEICEGEFSLCIHNDSGRRRNLKLKNTDPFGGPPGLFRLL